MSKLKRWQKWTLAGVGAALVVAVGGPLVYKLFNRADEKAEKDFEELVQEAGASTSAPASTTIQGATTAAGPTTAVVSPGSGELSGTWKTITTAALDDTFYVGYRVDEVLGGQNVTANGRTNQVTGSLTFERTTLTGADFTVDMATVRSDRSQRDNQFRGRVMAVDQFPTATFVLTQPIDIGAVPADAQVVTFSATGDLTLRGTTKSVTFDIKAFVSGGRITVTGEIPIVFAEWGIPNPSFGPVDTEDHGLLEFLLSFEKG